MNTFPPSAFDGPAAAAPESDPAPSLPRAVRVSVRYRPREFIAASLEGARLGGATRAQLAGVALKAALAFVVQRLVRGTCVFEFNAEGLARTAGRRRMVRSWKQVERLYAMKDAYLFELDDRFLPVPHRVFTAQQRGTLLRLIPDRLRGL